MRNFSAFSALLRAPLFSRALYVDVATQWRGIAAGYLFLILLITWLAVLIKATLGVTDFLNNDAPAAMVTFPEIKIEKGIASSPVNQPYIMKTSRGIPIFALDTTGASTNPSDLHVQMLVTRTEIVQEQAGGVIQRRPLAALPDMTVNGPIILGWIRMFRNLLIPVGLPLMVAGSFLLRLLWALLLALLGMGINSLFSGSLSLGQLFRLAVVSMTTSLLATTLLSLLGLNLGCFEWVLFPLITIGYLAFAVKVSVESMRPLTAFPVQFNTPTPSTPPSGDNLRTLDDLFP